ncbi:MAG: hypothetical protein J2P17_22275 [Mycobacterium sp.]|nr:hypothetical protein [Mycobacterium sp.]
MIATVLAGFSVITTLGPPLTHATSINCQHSGPVMGHPGMEYICYVHHDDGHKEIFYAPGPNARP